MARYNEILVGRFNRALQKLFSMKGGPPAPQLASEVSATHTFFNGAENRYLEGWNRFGFSGSTGAVAAQRGAAQLRNPVGSNVMIVVEKILFTSAALADAPLIDMVTKSTDLTVSGYTLQRFDARGQQNPVGVMSVSGTGPAVTTQFYQGSFPANGSLEVITFEDQEIPILPGDALVVHSGNLNQSLVFSIWWRERMMEESELR
jgi:hypothetical protein